MFRWLVTCPILSLSFELKLLAEACIFLKTLYAYTLRILSVTIQRLDSYIVNYHDTVHPQTHSPLSHETSV